MKLKMIILALVGAAAISACNNTGSSDQTSSTSTNSINSLSSNAVVDATVDVTDLNPQDWQKDWQDQISKLSSDEQLKLKEIGYYVHAAKVNLDKIAPGANTNPENVKRIERLMPRANFEKTFPLTAHHQIVNGFDPADVYSYSNFLKAAAVIPGYCGDFSGYPGAKTAEMADPDTLCKRMLATTFAHAVQETGNFDSNNLVNVRDKIVTTFTSVAEADSTPEHRAVGQYLDDNGPFSLTGKFASVVAGKYYYGRGAKQLSYPSNYANLSLMIYGNLLLVEDPDLVAGDNILPYLSAIVYAVQPKNGRPSIAEVMDGSFKKYAQGTSVAYAKLGFPFTIALVNGGPECNGNPKTLANTQTRLRSFRYFSEAGNLFTSGFALTDAETNATSCDNVKYDDPSIWASSQRYYYFDNTCNLVKWDSGNPVFGGTGYRDAVCNGTPSPSPDVNPTPAPSPTTAPEAADYKGFKLTVLNDSNRMGIDKLHIHDVRAKDAGFDLAYMKEATTTVFPNATPWNADLLAKYKNHIVLVTFSPTWEQDSEDVHTYECSPFNFNKDMTVSIYPSSKPNENECYVYPTDEE